MDPVRIYDYLSTARSHLFGWVRPLAPERYAQDHAIGLGSLARTLHHIKAAEWGYMERIRGRTEPLGQQPLENDPDVSRGAPLPFPALETTWIEQAAHTRADLAAAA